MASATGTTAVTSSHARKRSQNASGHQRRRLRRKGLVEQASERKILYPIRIPEGVLGRIMRLTHEGIARGTHPWKTPSETVRALLIMGLESLKGIDPVVDEMLPYLNLTKQFDGITSSRREAQAAMNRAATEIGELLGIQAKQEALQYYHVTLAAACEMPATVWRDWLVSELKHKFPQLDKQVAPSVSLTTATAAATNGTGKKHDRRKKR